MTREQMFDHIISILGYEHKATIWFIQFCEENPHTEDAKLYVLLQALLELIYYVKGLEK